MKTIEIIITPDGTIQVESKGFAGRECLDAGRAIEQALGTRGAERLTSEFYVAVSNASEHVLSRDASG